MPNSSSSFVLRLVPLVRISRAQARSLSRAGPTIGSVLKPGTRTRSGFTKLDSHAIMNLIQGVEVGHAHFPSGLPLCRTATEQESGFQPDRDADPGAGYRRDHRHLLARRSDTSSPAALRQPGSPGHARRTYRRQPAHRRHRSRYRLLHAPEQRLFIAGRLRHVQLRALRQRNTGADRSRPVQRLGVYHAWRPARAWPRFHRAGGGRASTGRRDQLSLVAEPVSPRSAHPGHLDRARSQDLFDHRRDAAQF